MTFFQDIVKAPLSVIVGDIAIIAPGKEYEHHLLNVFDKGGSMDSYLASQSRGIPLQVVLLEENSYHDG